MTSIIKCLTVAASLSFLACGTQDSGAPSSHEGAVSEAKPVSTSVTGSASQMFASFEALGSELEARASAGQLADSLRDAWSEAAQVRAEQEVKALITQIRQHASSAELLATDEEVVDRYVDSYESVVQELSAQESAGTLDAELAQLFDNLQAQADAVANSPDAEVRAKTFCCKVALGATLRPDDYLCNEWHTVGAWAATKCGAIAVGNATAPILSKGSCDWSNCAN